MRRLRFTAQSVQPYTPSLWIICKPHTKPPLNLGRMPARASLRHPNPVRHHVSNQPGPYKTPQPQLDSWTFTHFLSNRYRLPFHYNYLLLLHFDNDTYHVPSSQDLYCSLSTMDGREAFTLYVVRPCISWRRHVWLWPRKYRIGSGSTFFHSSNVWQGSYHGANSSRPDRRGSFHTRFDSFYFYLQVT